MSKIVIGIDPDSDKHGVAVYINGKLTGLECLSITDFLRLIPQWKEMGEVSVHIEDVCAMKAVFAQRQSGNKSAVQQSMARRLGMCQQAQIELERIFNHFMIFPVKHKISKAWKKDKKQFELLTVWTGRSNEDTRSAAYFGYLGLKQLEV